jgi:Aspartyl protease
MSFSKAAPTDRLRSVRRFSLSILPLVVGMVLPAVTPAASLAVGLQGGFRIVSVKPGSKPAPKILAQGNSLAGAPVYSYYASPPLEGPTITVAISITDLSGGDLDIEATTNVGLAGSYLPGSTTNVIFGLLDSGSSTHLVSYNDSLSTAIQDDLTGDTATASGVDGSIDLDISGPAGFFADGLQDLDARGNPQPALMLGQGNFEGLVNTVDNYDAGVDIPTLIGAPFLAYFPAYIRNSQPIHSPLLGKYGTSPAVTFYADPSDPAIPSLAHKIFLQVRPPGQTVVAYIPSLEGILPAEPTTLLSGQNLASALYFTASSMTFHEGTSSSSGLMIVDTGSQATVLSQIAAAELNLDIQNPDFTVDVQGLASTITAPGFYVDSASVPAQGGAVNWTNVPVIILDVTSPEGGTTYGIFGSNLTANRDLLFNAVASSPYLGVTDPIVPPLMAITAFRRTGPNTAEVDWHAEPAPPVLYLDVCTNLRATPPIWTPVATNTLATITGTLSVSGIAPGDFFRLDAPR